MISELNSDKALPGVNRNGQVVHCCVCYPSLLKFVAAFPHLAEEVARGNVTSTYCQRHFDELKAQTLLTNFRPAGAQLN